jgi:fructokinase
LLHAIELAKKNKVLISFDPNLRKDLITDETLELIHRLLKYVDIFIPSEEEILWITNTKTIDDAIGELDIERIIITRGAKGCVMYHEDKKIECEPFKVNVIDTTGAGDAFSAGITVGILKGFEDYKLLKFASAVAALSIQKVGAISSLPKLEEVEKFLKSNCEIF